MCVKLDELMFGRTRTFPETLSERASGGELS